MIHVIKIRDKVQFACFGVFGDAPSHTVDEIDSHVNGNQDLDEVDLQDKINFVQDNGTELCRIFDTLAEANAYWAGIEDMDGWLGYTPTDIETHSAIYGDDSNIQLLSIIQ
jgi:hypothetical protein